MLLKAEHPRSGRRRDPLEARLRFGVVGANVRLGEQTPEHQAEAKDGPGDGTDGRNYCLRIPPPRLYGASAVY